MQDFYCIYYVNAITVNFLKMVLNDMRECVIMAMWKKERLKKGRGMRSFLF